MNRIHPQTVAEGFSQSELSMLSDCQMKWNLRYNLRLQLPGSFNFHFMVGHIIHAAFEEIYKTNFKRYSVATLQFPEGAIPAIGDIAKAEYWNEVIPQMMKAYVAYWQTKDQELKIVSFEEEIAVEYKGFNLRGKIDMTAWKGKALWLYDHKSSAKLSRETVTGWDFRFQFLFYLWLKTKQAEALGLKTKFKGYAVNMIKKPELRQGKAESLQQFAMRLFADMIEEPEKYFYREYYPVTSDVLDHFEKEVVEPKLDYLRLGLTNPELFHTLFENKNTNECQPIGKSRCQNIDICRHGLDKVGHLYQTLEHKHQELEHEYETD